MTNESEEEEEEKEEKEEKETKEEKEEKVNNQEKDKPADDEPGQPINWSTGIVLDNQVRFLLSRDTFGHTFDTLSLADACSDPFFFFFTVPFFYKGESVVVMGNLVFVPNNMMYDLVIDYFLFV